MLPDAGTTATTQESCEAQGCCFAGPQAKEAWQPDVYLASCFYPNNEAAGYELADPAQLDASGLGEAKSQGEAPPLGGVHMPRPTPRLSRPLPSRLPLLHLRAACPRHARLQATPR